MRKVSDQEAEAFIRSSGFVWHQRFHLSDQILAPGVNDIEYLLAKSNLPASMAGLSVLDVGTCNGGVAFECERRGARHVVGVDIYDPGYFGFAEIAHLVGSKAEFLQCSLYELPDRLSETFDVIIFWGVLYHLRHPLLGLDALRQLSRGLVTVETAVADWIDGQAGPLARFHQRDDLFGDGSNWWSPTVECLHGWCRSAGFQVLRSEDLTGSAQRVMVELKAAEGKPEYQEISYEGPLQVRRIP